jgi:hypothetical protein
MSSQQLRREPAGTRAGGQFAPDTAGKAGPPAVPAAPVPFTAPDRSDLNGRRPAGLTGQRLADMVERIQIQAELRDAQPTAQQRAMAAIDEALTRVTGAQQQLNLLAWGEHPACASGDPDTISGAWQTAQDSHKDAHDALAAARSDYERLDPTAHATAPRLPDDLFGQAGADKAYSAGISAGQQVGRRAAGNEIAAMLADRLGAAWDPHEGQWVLEDDYGRTVLPGLPAPPDRR